jgi:hypothetical protein
MELLDNTHILDNRGLVRGLAQHDDNHPVEIGSRIHTSFRLHGAIFPPESDGRIGPPTVEQERRARSRQVLAFGAALWVALSA